MKLTNKTLKAIIPPESNYKIYWDNELPAFGIRVTSNGVKSYVVQRRIKGGNGYRRITLGRVEHIGAPEKAREEAHDVLNDMRKGIDPVDKVRQKKIEGLTLEKAREVYLEGRELKPRTIIDVKKTTDRYLESWLTKPISKITPEMVVKKHREIAERGKVQANMTMKYLRAIISFAMQEYTDHEGKPIISVNPVSTLSMRKLWYRVNRRRTVLEAHQLKKWISSVESLSDNARDYLLFLLFTGLRPEEAATLKWDTVDLISKKFTILDTKNYEPHTLPLSDYLFQLLKNRYENKKGDYVFNSRHGNGHIKCIDGHIRMVTKDTGIKFCRYDLRRTFATIAESLDISAYCVKRLLNHSLKSDVTAGYIVTDIERLRRPMQRITDFILKAANQKESAEVVEIKGMAN